MVQNCQGSLGSFRQRYEPSRHLTLSKVCVCGPRALAHSVAGYLKSQWERKNYSSGSDLWPVWSVLLSAALRAGHSRMRASKVTGLLWTAIYLQRGSPDSSLLGPDLCIGGSKLHREHVCML